MYWLDLFIYFHCISFCFVVNKYLLNFSTLYTTIPHDLLKSRITYLVHNSFKQKDGEIRYSFIKAGKYGNCYFTKKDEAGEGKYSAKVHMQDD